MHTKHDVPSSSVSLSAQAAALRSAAALGVPPEMLLRARVASLLARHVASGAACGVQVAAFSRGGTLALCESAGAKGPLDPRPVGADDLFVGFSCGKALCALLVHALADRGDFGARGVDTRVAEVWTVAREVAATVPSSR